MDKTFAYLKQFLMQISISVHSIRFRFEGNIPCLIQCKFTSNYFRAIFVVKQGLYHQKHRNTNFCHQKQNYAPEDPVAENANATRIMNLCICMYIYFISFSSQKEINGKQKFGHITSFQGIKDFSFTFEGALSLLVVEAS